MKKILFFLFLFTGSLSAQETTPPCYYELAATFFPYPLVGQALSMHKVTQDRWAIVYNSLQANSAGIPNLLRERASRMNPNPLQPYQREAAAALMRIVLEEVFAQSMRANYVNDPYAIHSMFNYIRVQQATRVRACLGEGPMVDRPITE